MLLKDQSPLSLLLAMNICVICTFASAQEVIRDYDGYEYKTVKMGSQQWMAENLKSYHDSYGNKIKRVCYKLINENCDKYGGLYSWNYLNIPVENDTLKDICPVGWHIPDEADWDSLIEYLGGADSAALKLKDGSYPEFNLQYGGNYHYRLKNYNYLDNIAYYWSSCSFSKTAAWIRMIGRKNVNSNRSTVPKVYCLSVRCVKD